MTGQKRPRNGSDPSPKSLDSCGINGTRPECRTVVALTQPVQLTFSKFQDALVADRGSLARV